MRGMKEQLPKVDAARVQSSESETCLRQVIREPRFISREQKPDYGVDFLAEVLTDEREATNWHLPIQLRSENPPRFVEEGAAISVGFRTSALNYLFRSQGRSIVVVYDAAGKRLYWQWTDQVILALDDEGRAWRQQAEVTVRVPTRNVLTEDAADAIRREVLAYEQRAATVRESVLIAGPTAAATAANLARGGDAVAVIRDGGPALVSSGLHREVLSLLRQVPEVDWIDDAAVVTTVAFAYERVGSPLQALYFSNLIPDDAAGMDEDDKALLAHIRSNARLSLGQIDAEAHWSELRELAERFPTSFIAAQALLITLSADVALASKQRNGREEVVLRILERARVVASNHAEQTRSNSRSRWALDVLLGHIEMEVADQLILTTTTRVQFAEQLGFPIPVPERVAMARATMDLVTQATKRFETITKEAGEAGATEWEGIARLTFLESHIKRVNLFNAIGVPGDEEADLALLKNTAASAEKAAVQLAAADYRMLAFRARRLQGEVYALLEDQSGVDAILRDLAIWARQLGLRPDAATIVGPFRPPSLDTDDRGLAQMWADETPEELADIEESMMRSLALPEGRRPIVQRDLAAIQRSNREKFDHCRHLDVLQDLRHTQARATHYANDPARVGQCSLLGHRSQVEATEIEAVIRAFKLAYCGNCPRRQPFERS